MRDIGQNDEVLYLVRGMRSVGCGANDVWGGVVWSVWLVGVWYMVGGV